MDGFEINRRNMLTLTGASVFGVASASGAQDTGDQQLSYGDTIESSLSQDSPYDEGYNGYHETYTFSGEEGDVVSIEMRPTVGDGVAEADHAARLELYDPAGEEIRDADPYNPGYGAAGINEAQLETTGTYTIVATTADYSRVSSYDNDEESFNDTFSYELRLHEFLGAGTEIGYDSTTTSELTTESNFQYEIDLNGYYDVYTFSGTEGDIISLEIRPDVEGGVTAEDYALRLALYDPAGEELRDAFPHNVGYGATGMNEVELPTDGTYTLIVTTAQPDYVSAYANNDESFYDTFAYELRLHELLGDGTEIDYNSSTTGELTSESNFQYEIDLNGYYDVYTFSGEEDDVISLEMRPQRGENVDITEHAPRLALYDPAGEEIEDAFPNDVGYGATGMNEVQLESTGTYTVIATTARADYVSAYVGDESYYDTFAYELRLHEFLGAGTEINHNSSINGELSRESNFQDYTGLNGYYDVYTFSGQSGDAVDISVVPDAYPDGTDHAVRIELLDPTGAEIQDTFPNSVGYGATSLDDVELPVDGMYTIVVTTANHTSITSYSNREECYYDTFGYTLQCYGVSDGVDRSLEYGETVTDTITTDDIYADRLTGYHKRYSFEGEEGTTISAEMRMAVPDGHAAHLRLYGPDGTRVEEREAESGAVQLDRVELEASGTHTLVATTAEASTATVYDSTEAARTATPQYELRFYEYVGDRELLVDGDTVTTELNSTANFLESLDGYYDAYVTTLSEGDELSVQMNIDQQESNAAQLIVLEPDESTAEDTNVDSGHASIDGLTAEMTGEHTIVATSEPSSSVYDTTVAGQRASFQYELTVDGPANNPPMVEAITAEPERAAVGDLVELSVDALDPNGDDLAYQWAQVIGAFPDPEADIDAATSPTASFVAPEADGETQLTFEVTVSDTAGGELTKQVTMIVDPELDSTTDPAAAFDVTPADPAVDETVTFDASNATGTIVEYRWDFDFGGTFSADATTADPVTTHAYGESGTRTVALDVENEAGTVDRKTIDVTVIDGSEHASGVDQSVWDAVTDQNGGEDELTFQDLVDGIQAYQNDEPVGGLELSYQDLVDLIQWYQQ
ncbi:PKD domain-containing protein [Halomontanus rarus]|uniref:PKD domain-containing protein n=1 Tax=Halomontanus rarus TaxID=3034020 RepID=UPI001A999097